MQEFLKTKTISDPKPLAKTHRKNTNSYMTAPNTGLISIKEMENINDNFEDFK